MPYVCFSNPGEIDLRLVTTMGVNVKETAGAIGHFGTGLKYALAVVLRLGGSVILQSGLTQVMFNPVPTTIRGKEFTLIGMNILRPTHAEGEGADYQELAFTTELGKHWHPWMAYREFLCNAWDEKGSDAVIDNIPVPAVGFTRVIIECPYFLEIAQNPKPWLLHQGLPAGSSKKLLWKTPVLECYAGESNFGFYKGIQVVEFSKPTVFTYNIISHADLTEDRTMHTYVFIHHITSEVIGRDKTPIPPSVLRAITQASLEHAERDFYWPSYISPRQEILDAVAVTPNLRTVLTAHRPPKELDRSLFDDLDDAAPAPPHSTCPYINTVQEKLRLLSESLRVGKTLYSLEAIREVCASVQEEILLLLDNGEGDDSPLEMLRTQNETLRSIGKYWRSVCKDLTSTKPSTKGTTDKESK